MKSVDPMKLVKYTFLATGIGMLAGTVFLYINTSAFLKNAIKAEGTVIELIPSYSDGSTTYRPAVRFINQQGKEIEFASSSSSNPPSYSEGQTVEILYRPEEPQKAEINSFFSLWGAPTILGGLGSAFFTVGAVLLAVPKLKGREEKYLKQQGTPIKTEFQSVDINTMLSVNDRHPFQVITQWQNPSTSEIHVFESGNIWYDPSEFITNQQITVYIEKENPKKYWVDLSFLPKMAE
ncbi:DUF3592 domain-containing protein [Phormidium sp. FACHB-592]|uniref:DUF3592 domain-containing protein n=1 Tax=Stenomitos frigidus AS-A4 TaxID=2933935 RepID=A0ABV0KMD6_9CYAN|nr:DUF3592 domain-containing protein [Phormidium sp. FACHB-592]MBD2074590.1 DUF3592 domain-containing protein [Phormidium sp. FACHB-592]